MLERETVQGCSMGYMSWAKCDAPNMFYWTREISKSYGFDCLKREDIPRPTFLHLPFHKSSGVPFLPACFLLQEGEKKNQVGKTVITINFGTMMIASRFSANSSGFLLHPSYNKLSFQLNNYQRTRFACHKPNQSASEMISRGSSLRKPCTSSRHVVSVGSNRRQLSFDDDLPEEPFWLSLIRETIWGIRSLSVFLAEQPSQLKYIEWPSFVYTLKTAILTLVLVAGLIVALASVDSVLCYVLALLLRRTP